MAAELRRLANNVGEARMWAGVHWHDDHVAGQKTGRSAYQQLKVDCVPDFMLPMCNSIDPPPDARTMARRADEMSLPVVVMRATVRMCCNCRAMIRACASREALRAGHA